MAKRGIQLVSWHMATLLLALVLLLNAGRSTAYAQTGGPEPRAYIPSVFNDANLSWQWLPASRLVLTPTAGYNGGPVMAIDHAGQVHLMWGTTDSRYPKYIYHSYLTAEGWTGAAPVAQSLGTSITPWQPLVGPDDTLHLMWLNQLTSNDPRRILYAAFRDGEWSADEEVYRASASYINQLWAAPQVNEYGQVQAAMTFVNLNLYPLHALRTAQGWSPPAAIPSDLWLMSVLADRTGGVHLYTEGLSPRIAGYSYWREEAFVVQNQSTGVDLRYRQTLLDAGHNLHIYWTAAVPIPGGQVTGLYHQCLDSNLNLTPPEVLSGASAAGDVAAAADETGRAVLTWRETASGRVRATMWRGCLQSERATFPEAAAAGWHPLALSLSGTPNMLCGLTKQSGFAIGYAVQCVRLLQ